MRCSLSNRSFLHVLSGFVYNSGSFLGHLNWHSDYENIFPLLQIWIEFVDKYLLRLTWTSFLVRIVQAQPGSLTLFSTKQLGAWTGKVWQAWGDAEVQMRLHFHFNFTVQFKSPYSLSSNFIFSISNITISFRKLILRVTRKYTFSSIWGSETKIGQVDAKSGSEN